MDIALHEEPITGLLEHAFIPIAFEVDRVVVVGEGGAPGGFVLSERTLDAPYVKDYDAIDGGPARWAERFDVSNWGLISAHWDGQRVGGTVIAFNAADVDMMEGRGDLAVLWDIRVRPEFRWRGVGSALFRAAESGLRQEAAESSRSRPKTST